MDEIFHYNQTLQFHKGNFTWNDKITTPPGLYSIYILPYLDLKIARSVSALAGLGQAYLLEQMVPRGSLLVLYPPSFFFHFLFYTDSMSTFLVLLGWYWMQRGHTNSAGFVIFLSLWFRQTNIIWLLFIAGTSIVEEQVGLNVPVNTVRLLIQLIQSVIVLIQSKMLSYLWKFKVFVLSIAGFAGFLIWNKGIALGDKTNHTMSVHIPQLFYFAAQSLFFLLPCFNWWKEIKLIPILFKKNYKWTIFLLPFVFYGVKKFT